MKIISIINNKGGVGKTTTTFNLSHYLAKKGKKVLVIDLDSQKNLTTNFTDENISSSPSIGDYLLERMYKINPVIINENLHLISSGETEKDISLLFEEGINSHKRLKFFLEELNEIYDIAIIDTAPSFNMYTKSAMYAGEVYTVLNSGKNELNGLEATKEELEIIQKKLKGIILIRKDNSKLYEKTNQNLDQNYSDIKLKTVIRQNIALSESIFENKSIFDFAPKSNGAKDYKDLSEEIIIRENL